MKLLYFHFDFTQNGANPEGYRGFKICELNFGTKSQYHMEPPTQARPTYLLTQEERPEGGRIVPGFWGDERIYNVSALVGDNGSGKSMLIHEMIRCLMTSFHEHMAFEKLEEPQYPFVFVTEGVYGELYLVNFHIAPEVSFFSKEWKRISLPIDQKNGKMISLNWGLAPPKPRKEYGVLRKSKMIYFSNAITMSDKAQYDYWNYYEVVDSKGYSINTQYVSPLYDCSLIADMSEAVKTSKAGINCLDKHLNTYFNFRSYQEARYVFDRNQRKILLDLRDKHKLPVPLPKLLKLKIINPFLLNKMLFSQREISQKDAFSNFYNNDFFDTNAQRIAAALSMNCLMAYCAIETRGYFDYIWNCAIRESEHLQANTFFSRLLTLCKAENRKRSSNYFKICQNYIQFLWRNIELIDTFVKPTSVRLNVADDITVEIPLGDILDSQLEEFLIHFITLTRAVSKNQYFVIYNWGLSSGESNLLHMFTKLWYALSVNSFNNEKYIAKITDQSAKEICNINQEKNCLQQPIIKQCRTVTRSFCLLTRRI